MALCHLLNGLILFESRSPSFRNFHGPQGWIRARYVHTLLLGRRLHGGPSSVPAPFAHLASGFSTALPSVIQVFPSHVSSATIIWPLDPGPMSLGAPPSSCSASSALGEFSLSSASMARISFIIVSSFTQLMFLSLLSVVLVSWPCSKPCNSFTSCRNSFSSSDRNSPSPRMALGIFLFLPLRHGQPPLLDPLHPV
jgi:hypothetical protein